jgi:curved DNA-binding protein CbpA
MKKNLYELLEVSPEASSEEIKASMIRLGKKYAAESQKNKTARILFNEIKEAYKVLASPYLRASYDDLLKQTEKEKNQKKVARCLKTWIKRSGKKIRKWHVTKWFLKKWQVIEIHLIKVWHVFKQGVMKAWELSQQLMIKGWRAIKREIIKKWHNKQEFSEQNEVNQKILTEEDKLEKVNQEELELPQRGENLGKQGHVKGWKVIQQRGSSEYIRHTLIHNEKILYQAETHWFFDIDFVGILFFITSTYLLIFDPLFISDEMPTVLLWIPLFKQNLDVSVWHLGLLTLIFVSLMVIWEAFVENKSTEFVITSRRILYKRGMLGRALVDLKLGRFESITVKQNIFGRTYDFGTLTITGVGCVKMTIPHIVAPLRFKRTLWQVLEEYVE